MLLGQAPTDELLAAAGAKTAEVMLEVTGRRWSTEYKEVAIQALAERTLRRVLTSPSPVCIGEVGELRSHGEASHGGGSLEAGSPRLVTGGDTC